MSGRERLEVLVIGPNCDGTDVGEAWSTCQWVRGLAESHDVTLLTYRKRDRPSAVEQLPGVEVVAWLDLPLVGRFERFNSMAKPGYVAFYLRARRWLHAAKRVGRRFDVVHQIAPLALRYPCPAIGLDWPVVIGPVAGSLATPDAFEHEVGGESWYTRLRRLDAWRLRRDPWLRHTYAEADAVIGVAPYVRDVVLADVPPRRFELCSETGVAELPPERPVRNTPSDDEPDDLLRLLYVGRIVRPKGLRDAVRAMGEVGSALPWRLDVLGDGPDRAACEAEAAMLGIDGRVHFHGRLPRPEVERYYREADVFLFPSFREPSGNVVLEAMSHGLVSIVADRGGPAAAVTEACGIRVPVTEPATYAKAIAQAVRRLAEDRTAREAMGRAARERIARHYLWPRKIEWLTGFYRELLQSVPAPAMAAEAAMEVDVT